LEPFHCQQNGMTKYETTKWDKQTHQKNNKSHKNRKITKSKKKYKNLKKNYQKAIETT
jgi:Tfp pilus assembly protein PilE